MPVVTVSSRDFTRHVAAAKRAADTKGPVFITNRGRQTHVLLTIGDYERMADQPGQSLLNLFDGLPGAPAVEFEVPRWDVAVQVPKLG
jgi:hypothetical protein